jgi:MazG family protein
MPDTPGTRFDDLVRIMRALRAPGGCPWDREQTLRSLRPFVLEETYELLEALDRSDPAGLREELGDFLYEAVFLAQIAEEAGHFSIADAIDGVARKLVRRHPHVFTPDGRPLAGAGAEMSADDVVRKWEDLKAAERGDRGKVETSVLSGVPRSLPALLRAYEISGRAASVGFDWDSAADVLDKMAEELAELRVAVRDRAAHPEAVEEELGDFLFAVANCARKLRIEPEAALRMAGDKFQARFEGMEAIARAEGLTFSTLSPDQQNALWARVKQAASGLGLASPREDR